MIASPTNDRPTDRPGFRDVRTHPKKYMHHEGGDIKWVARAQWLSGGPAFLGAPLGISVDAVRNGLKRGNLGGLLSKMALFFPDDREL